MARQIPNFATQHPREAEHRRELSTALQLVWKDWSKEPSKKAGIVAAADFAGTPLVKAVVFTTPFPTGTVYAVYLGTVVSANTTAYTPVILSKSEAGFTISLTVNVSTDLVSIDWTATAVGEGA